MTFIDDILHTHELDAQTITLVTHNSSNKVFMVGNTHVLKIFADPSSDDVAAKEATLCKSLHRTVPTPIVVDYGDTVNSKPCQYVLFERAEGEVLSDYWNDGDQRALGKQLGAYLGTIHSTPVSTVTGSFGSDLKTQPQNKLSTDYIDSILTPIETGEYLTRTQTEAIREYIGERINGDPVKEVGLLHGCYRFNNMLARGNKITCILDWEDASLGDPLEELSLALYRTIPVSLHEVFIESYRAVYLIDDITLSQRRLLYPLLYYLKYLPEITQWHEFPGKQAYYKNEIKRILKETIGEEN